MITWDRPVVIGSGPSGVAVAHALISRGVRPIILDGGLTARAGADEDSQAAVKADPGAKTWFGSDFATRQAEASPLTYASGLTARASHAVGGLSRIWGATNAIYSDFGAWPNDARPHADDIAAVRFLMPVATTVFEDEKSPRSIVGSSRSGAARDAFASRNNGRWIVQNSELAIDTAPSSPTRCTLLGTCLNGCSRNSIWYSGEQIAKWKRQGAIDHRPGSLVLALVDTDDGVRLTVSEGDQTFEVLAPRVFVAAGAIATAALIVASSLRDRVLIRDTATAFGAMVSLRPRRETNAHHGLSQWWVRSRDAAFSAQVYPPDPANAKRLAERVPRPLRWRRAIDRGAGLLHPVISYLSSDVSDALLVERGVAGVHVRSTGGGVGLPVFREHLTALARDLGRSGYLLPVAATQFTSAGTGYHSGASLPHGTLTDEWGRLPNIRRVHIVDSSVLPRIEVGSITPTVMTNAHRIGRTVQLEEDR